MASQQGAESVADMSGLRAFRIIRITRALSCEPFRPDPKHLFETAFVICWVLNLSVSRIPCSKHARYCKSGAIDANIPFCHGSADAGRKYCEYPQITVLGTGSASWTYYWSRMSRRFRPALQITDSFFRTHIFCRERPVALTHCSFFVCMSLCVYELISEADHTFRILGFSCLALGNRRGSGLRTRAATSSSCVCKIRFRSHFPTLTQPSSAEPVIASSFACFVRGLAEEAVLQLFSFSDPCVFRLDYKDPVNLLHTLFCGRAAVCLSGWVGGWVGGASGIPRQPTALKPTRRVQLVNTCSTRASVCPTVI